MYRNPFSFPYPTTPRPSAWGPPTANTNFCEADHQFSSHIAELINTLSNLVYIVYAYRGLQHLHDRHRLTPSTALPHIGLLCVGLGSAAYHATLLKLPQLADEIGMAIPTGAVAAALFSCTVENPRDRTAAYTVAILVVTTVYVVHCISFTNLVHYPAFGGMCLFIGRRCRLLTRQIPDPDVRRNFRARLRRGRLLFLSAFALWMVDRAFCSQLSAVREWLGLPWGWLLELHGWWHVGTGMGAAVFIQVAEELIDRCGVEKGDKHGHVGEQREVKRL